MRTARLVALLAVVSVVVVFAWGQAGSQPSRITQAIDESKLSVLRGNTHPFARPEFDRGPAPANLPMERMMLVLKSSPEQGAQLDQLLAEQQDRSSANYHKWLTPEEFGAQFGASEADIQQVTAWLQSHGFTIDNVANGHNVLEFSGNAAQVQAAFHTAIHKYEIAAKQYWANANDPAIPAALAPVVAGVASLNNFPRQPARRFAGVFTRDSTLKLKAGPAARPEFTSTTGCTGGTAPCYALTPFDFATIYNVLPLWNANITGSGETIAIVSDSDINTADFTNFRSLFGLTSAQNPGFTGTLNVIHNGTDPGNLGPNSNESEADVDVEWAGSTAPGATIDLVVSKTTNASFGGDLSASYIINNKTGSVLGYSFGICEFFLGTTGNQLYAATGTGMWVQAASEGITVVVSTGDNGATGCDGPQNTPPLGGPCVAPNQTAGDGSTVPWNDPALCGLAVNGIASTIYNVAVGGTDFNDASNPTTYFNSTNSSTTQASVKGYIPETAYNDTCTNIALDMLASSSAGQDAIANCNTFAAAPQPPNGTTFELSELVVPFGGGGGPSNCTTPSSTASDPSGCAGGYGKPPWQTALTPADSKRDLPDISLFAGDGTIQSFYLYCEQDANPGNAACSLSPGTSSSPFPDIAGIGGTSVSTEAFVGMIALLNQKLGSSGPVGLPNQNLYALAGKSGASCQSSGTLTSSCIFYQETSGTISMPCTSTYGAASDCNIPSGDSVGITEINGAEAYSASTSSTYNLATGLGSINAYNLVNEWNLGSSTTPDFVISANPAAVNVPSAGASGTTTITITAVNGFSDTVTFGSSACSGLPTGATCAFSTNPVPAGGTTTLTIQTSASGFVPPAGRPGRFVQWRTPGLLALGVLLALSILWTFRGKNREWGLAAASVVFLVFLGIAGCGGSSSSSSKGTVATPTFSPAAGTFTSAQSVTISDATSGASIFYTTNGTTPTTSSTPYTGPITVNSTETIQAIAAASGMTNSGVATAAYTINAPVPAAITITGTSTTGNVSHSTTVTLTVQ